MAYYRPHTPVYQNFLLCGSNIPKLTQRVRSAEEQEERALQFSEFYRGVKIGLGIILVPSSIYVFLVAILSLG
ncbi:MAG: hypothetical protein A3J06_02320 [Candidatus Moranbacteria bacterium RIFCSPLOWO2_02_FULL_48_19]|nr:MAG: hypothetical protein A3J06_02320 [Candidatus Moranbacteria bacterium RIFCSPLOWO2_02_FULL_48_19]